MTLRRTGEAGFSLVELMVVLVILALAGTVIISTLPPASPAPQREAEAMLDRLEAARQMALLSNRPTAVELSGSESRLLKRQSRVWTVFEGDELGGLLPIKAWPSKISVSVSNETLPFWIEFDPTGFNTEALLTLSDGTHTRQVRVLADGRAFIEAKAAS